METAIGYIRVSTEDQAKGGTSLEAQREAIKKYADAHGWRLAKIYADEGISGKKMAGRKALLQLLKDASEGKFQVMICYDIDRFGRDLRDIMNNRYDLEQFGVEEHFITSPEDSNFIKNIKAAVAEEEREKIRRRTMGGKLHLLKKGVPVGRLPFNRAYDKETGKWSFIDEQKNKHIRWAAKRYLNGAPFLNVVDELEVRGFKISRDYLGKVLSRKSGGTVDFNFRGQVFQMKIPRILDDETIRLIRNRLEFNNKNNRKDVKRYVLSGFINCLHCGRSLTGQSPPNTKRKYYIHPIRRNIPCPDREFSVVPLDMIENAVFKTIFENVYDEPAFDKAIQDALPDTEMIESLNKRIKDNQKLVRGIDSKLEKLVDAVMEGTLKRETIQKREDALYKQMDAVTEELERDKERIRFLPDVEKIQKQAKNIRLGLLDYFGSIERLQEMSFEEKRKLLHYLFDGKDKNGNPWGIYVRKVGKGQFEYHIRATLIEGFRVAKGDEIDYLEPVEYDMGDDHTPLKTFKPGFDKEGKPSKYLPSGRKPKYKTKILSSRIE